MSSVAVIQFPGTNCELDTKYAFEKIGYEVDIVWHKEEFLKENIDLIVIPGGFSYGDYLRSGIIAKFSPIIKAIKEYAESGGFILGICNGFQILTEIKLLEGTLIRNSSLNFISKMSKIKVSDNNNKFLNNLKKNDILNIPIAHAHGNFYIDDDGLKRLIKNNQIILQYCDEDGDLCDVNGSILSIAGICNKKRNIFGLMPHPERAIEKILNSEDGILMLKNFVN